MTTNNSIRICPNCNASFSLNLKRNGDPTKKQKECCSKSCAMTLRAAREGKTRVKSFTCEHCGKESARIVRKTKDSGRFCSRVCAVSHMSEARAEREACDRKEYFRLETIRPEVAALKRIRSNTKRRTRSCRWCNQLFIRPIPFVRTCSDECIKESAVRNRSNFRNSEAHKRGKRIRRSMERSKAGADRIDPIDVFDRAGWKCYLCGILTLKEKRGTSHYLAPELEHVVPLSKGGMHTLDNVACSCRRCNMDKGVLPLETFIRSKSNKNQ